MKRRILLVCVAAVVAVGGVLLWLNRGPRFSDVKRRDGRYQTIAQAVEAGYLEVRADGSFGPDEAADGAAVLTALLRALGQAAEPLEEQAAAHRLVLSTQEFDLNAPVTRLTAAAMAARGLDLLSIAGESPYDDCADGYVVKLWEKNVWREEGGLFRPEAPLTRAELAALACAVAGADVSAGAFRYSNYWVDELDGVPLNPYDPAEFQWENETVTYTGTGYTILRGVDVSGYQGDIDWPAVKAAGYDFAMIRVGGRFTRSGDLYDDSYFTRNIEGALAAGLRVGVYFFSQVINEEEGLEEAAWVLERIAGYDLTMPVALDWEYLDGGEARTTGVEPAEITAGVAAFCDAVEAAGYRAMFYCNRYCGYIKLDLRALTEYETWFAQYDVYPAFRYGFTMWQYTSQGQVDGIAAPVDVNLYFIPD